MAATPKPVRKEMKKEIPKAKEFLKKHNPAPTKQAEKKIVSKHVKNAAKLNVFESPKHEKIRKAKKG